MKLIKTKKQSPLFQASPERQAWKSLNRRGLHLNPAYTGYSPAMAELSDKIVRDAQRWGISFHTQLGYGSWVSALISHDSMVDFSGQHEPLLRQSSPPELRLVGA